MRVHRFYTGPDLKLKKDFWIHDPAIIWQWSRVLRFREGQNVILFDGDQTDRLYKVVTIARTEIHVQMITELERSLPHRNVYLFWSLLKKDNNDLVLQKCTELGVSNFVPIISERSIQKTLNIERARKIVVEASEQCGRSNIPHVREPVHLSKILEEYKDKLPLYICEQEGSAHDIGEQKLGVLIGPEGGWSDTEHEAFKEYDLKHLAISDHTLRAETAAIVAASKVL